MLLMLLLKNQTAVTKGGFFVTISDDLVAPVLAPACATPLPSAFKAR